MSSEVVETQSALVLARLQADLDELASLGLDTCADPEVIDLLRGLEAARNRIASIEHAVIVQADTRGLAWERGLKSTAQLLRQVQRIGINEARSRTAAAAILGPRRTLTGEPVEPHHARIAAAMAEGLVSPAAARYISEMIRLLPDRVIDLIDATPGLDVEAELVGHAVSPEIDFDALKALTRRTAEWLNPDGLFTELADRNKKRGLHIARHDDGSSTLTGELTAECTEHLLVAMDALAGPKPAVDGKHDPRSADQRQHDALIDLLRLVQRAQNLPQVGGVSATIVIHMNEDTYITGDGVATTGHGVRVPAQTAKDWAGHDARLMAVLRTALKPVASYTHLKRYFGEKQRLAMATRDGGCSFPGCDVKPNWCQSHHVIEYSESKITDLEQGTLVCGYHHREFARMGWECIMTDGLPTWTPPEHIDKLRRPVRNQIHHLAEHYQLTHTTPTHP